MDFIYQYSGLLAALIAILLIVAPTFFVKLNYQEEPISFVIRNKLAGLIFRSGLVITAVFLLIHTTRLVNVFALSHTSIGVLTYYVGTVCMFFVAGIDIDTNEPIHTAFTKGYFLLSTIGAALMSLEIQYAFSVFFLIAIAGGVGTMYLYLKRGLKAYSEYWGIFFSILWVVSFYVLK